MSSTCSRVAFISKCALLLAALFAAPCCSVVFEGTLETAITVETTQKHAISLLSCTIPNARYLNMRNSPEVEFFNYIRVFGTLLIRGAATAEGSRTHLKVAPGFSLREMIQVDQGGVVELHSILIKDERNLCCIRFIQSSIFSNAKIYTSVISGNENLELATMALSLQNNADDLLNPPHFILRSNNVIENNFGNIAPLVDTFRISAQKTTFRNNSMAIRARLVDVLQCEFSVNDVALVARRGTVRESVFDNNEYAFAFEKAIVNENEVDVSIDKSNIVRNRCVFGEANVYVNVQEYETWCRAEYVPVSVTHSNVCGFGALFLFAKLDGQARLQWRGSYIGYGFTREIFEQAFTDVTLEDETACCFITNNTAPYNPDWLSGVELGACSMASNDEWGEYDAGTPTTTSNGGGSGSSPSGTLNDDNGATDSNVDVNNDESFPLLLVIAIAGGICVLCCALMLIAALLARRTRSASAKAAADNGRRSRAHSSQGRGHSAASGGNDGGRRDRARSSFGRGGGGGGGGGGARSIARSGGGGGGRSRAGSLTTAAARARASSRLAHYDRVELKNPIGGGNGYERPEAHLGGAYDRVGTHGAAAANAVAAARGSTYESSQYVRNNHAITYDSADKPLNNTYNNPTYGRANVQLDPPAQGYDDIHSELKSNASAILY